jgi:hypothetical protein
LENARIEVDRSDDRRTPTQPRSPDGQVPLSELQNARVLLEEARSLSRNLAYHRGARLEARIGEALDEVDRRIQELRAGRD